MPPRAVLSEEERRARNEAQARYRKAKREKQTDQQREAERIETNAAHTRTRTAQREALKKLLDEANAAAAAGTATKDQEALIKEHERELADAAEYRRDYRMAKPEQERDNRDDYSTRKARAEAEKDAVYTSGDPEAIKAYEAKKDRERQHYNHLRRMRRNPEKYALAEQSASAADRQEAAVDPEAEKAEKQRSARQRKSQLQRERRALEKSMGASQAGAAGPQEAHEDDVHHEEDGWWAANGGFVGPDDPAFFKDDDHWNALYDKSPSRSHSLGQVKLSSRQSAIYRQSHAISHALF